MSIKNTFITLLLISCFSGLTAQRLDLDKYSFIYSYRLLPNIALDKSYLSYTVNISKANELGSLAGQSDTSKITIAGRKKVPSRAHFIVDINLDKVIFGKAEIKNKVEVTKDKDGKETSRKTLYYVEFRYSFEATAVVNDYKNVKLASYKISSRDDAKVYKSNAFESSKAASDIYNNQTKEISANIITEEIKNAYASFNASLNKDFGIIARQTKVHLWTLGSSKHPEYQAWKDACALVKSVLENITADSIPKVSNSQVNFAIDYFAGIASKYQNSEDKAERKLRYGSFYNLATIYLCLEQFDMAKENAQKIVENDFDVKDGNELTQEVNTIKSRLDKHQMTTQHFTLDLEHISLPQ